MAQIRNEQPEADIVCIRVVGEYDLADKDAASRAIRAALEADATGILGDLDECSFIDSSGLKWLLVARDKASELGKRFSVLGSGHQVRHLLAMTGVEEELGVAHSRDDALARLRDTPPGD